MSNKNVYIIAGSNGSGYAQCTYFVNADLIAQGLSPFSPQHVAIKAGKLVLEQIDELSDKGTEASLIFLNYICRCWIHGLSLIMPVLSR